MFYLNEDICNFLLCDSCKNELIGLVKVIPCGQSICEQCASQFEFKDGSFECSLCSSNHKGFNSWNDLPDNLKLMKLMELKPTEIYRGNEIAQINSKFSEANALKAKLESNLNDPDLIIKGHCDTLRNKVQVAFETSMENLTKELDKYKDEINAYEVELMELKNGLRNDALNQLKDNFILISTRIEEFIKEWNRILNDSNTNYNCIINANNKIDDCKKFLDEQIKSLNDKIFKNNLLEFSNDFTFSLISMGSLAKKGSSESISSI